MAKLRIIGASVGHPVAILEGARVRILEGQPTAAYQCNVSTSAQLEVARAWAAKHCHEVTVITTRAAHLHVGRAGLEGLVICVDLDGVLMEGGVAEN
jgi:hypothetical protein